MGKEVKRMMELTKFLENVLRVPAEHLHRARVTGGVGAGGALLGSLLAGPVGAGVGGAAGAILGAAVESKLNP